MHSLKLRKPLAFFDLETTGTNICTDRIVEICIAKAMPNGELKVKTWRINPTIPISAESSTIHGIYEEDIKNAPTFKELAHPIMQFFEGADLAGFNIIRFDVPMLMEEFLRIGLDFKLESRKMVDAQRIFHLMEPRSLTAAYRFYCNKELVNAHSAEADTLATFEVLCAQIDRYEGKAIKNEKGAEFIPIKNDVTALHELTAEKMIDLAGRLSYNDQGDVVVNFGKHKDRLLKEVLQKEPAFYDWVMKGEFPLDTKRKLTELKLKNLIK